MQKDNFFLLHSEILLQEIFLKVSRYLLKKIIKKNLSKKK